MLFATSQAQSYMMKAIIKLLDYIREALTQKTSK